MVKLLETVKKLDNKLDTLQTSTTTSTTSQQQPISAVTLQTCTSQGTTRASTSSAQLATPASLQKDYHLQQAVEERLKEYFGLEYETDSDDDREGEPKKKKLKGKKKSGRKRTAEDKVLKEVDWPHLYIYKGPSRKPAEYEKLTMAEFVHGSISIMQTCKDNKVKDLLLQHLKENMEDATEYSFESVRNYHAIVLSEMEQGRLTWHDQMAIQGLRRQYAQKYTPKTAVTPSATSSKSSTLPCRPWNLGLCKEDTDHDGKAHICAFCFSKGQRRKHQEKECRQKAKNGVPYQGQNR